ncbi:MAG: nitrogenase iron-molybdenum cofactor biosynthesis protein NifE [Candidatus Sumerlaeia bacterium]
MSHILEERKSQIHRKGIDANGLSCERKSAAGSVSQRACVFCGSRVVLYPISDALHLIHGPIGCAAYTWDIRGSLSSGPELHRLSFSTDLQEMDVINGGEKKLYQSLIELIDEYKPRAAFVYSTCIVGLIGDDVKAICKRVQAERNIAVIPVFSEGFAGTKKDGYKAACDAIAALVGTGDTSEISEHSINILGDFNIAGETWVIRDYYERMGIEVVSTVTGDGRVEDIRRMHGAKLNVVQCSGSMIHLAKFLEKEYGIPFIRVSYFGLEDTAAALYDVANHFGDEKVIEQTRNLVFEEIQAIMDDIHELREELEGKKAAMYVGGAFKAFSLVRALRMLGMRTVLTGTQTGSPEDYEQLREICDPGTIIVDDSNPLELCAFLKEKGCDVFIGGVKERPIAFKLGLGFCDHNHERKQCLAGFIGMLNFAREIHSTVMSPVWKFVPRKEIKQ